MVNGNNANLGTLDISRCRRGWVLEVAVLGVNGDGVARALNPIVSFHQQQQTQE